MIYEIGHRINDLKVQSAQGFIIVIATLFMTWNFSLFYLKCSEGSQGSQG